MTHFDLTTFAGVAALVTAIVGGIKKLFPKWIDGKEPLLALVLPVVIVAGVKASGAGFGAENWVNAMVGALMAGVGAGIVHDQVVNKVIANKTESKQ